METLSEAATFLESRGYLVERSPGAYPDGLLVAARDRYDDDDHDNDGTVWRYDGVFFLVPWQAVWFLIDVEKGEEAEFGSLLEAVNALLPRIRAWLVAHPE
jgi:hypothetical protein